MKLWITARTRSSDVNAIFAIAGTSIRCADHNTIWARRHRTTDPDPRRMIDNNLLTLVVGQVPNLHTFSHPPSLRDLDRADGGRDPPTLPVTALAEASA